MTNPTCPGCKAPVESIAYSKHFIFVDGVRHSAGWTWDLDCCGMHILDSEVDFLANEIDEHHPETPVRLVDRNTNRIVLEWTDLVPKAEIE